MCVSSSLTSEPICFYIKYYLVLHTFTPLGNIFTNAISGNIFQSIDFYSFFT